MPIEKQKSPKENSSDEEIREPEIKKQKIEETNENDEDLKIDLQPTTSQENEEKVKSEEIDQTDETKPETSKESVRSHSRQSLLETKELYKEPAFAEICSFANLFGALLGVKSMPFTKLEKLFIPNENSEVNQELIDLQIMLMRRIRITKHIKNDKWEPSLVKFCTYIPALDDETRHMQRYGYDNLSISSKLMVFKALCEAQFEFNLKFKENIFNTYYINEMRLAPFGVDKNGQPYWFQQDCEFNIRIYTEEPDDMSGGTWSLIARSESDLIKLIESLKQPNFGKNISDEEDDEEEEILDKPKKKSKKAIQQAAKAKIEENIDYVERLKPEIMEKYFKYLQKKFSVSCVYHDGTNLNKKKQEKEKKKNEKIAAQNAHEMNENKQKNDEEEEEKAEEDFPDVEPEVRVLPRRSARSNAITNIKSFISPGKKRDAEKSNNKTPPPLSTSEASDSTDVDGDSENESEQTLDSSDHEFQCKGFSFGKKGRPRKNNKPKTQRQAKPKTSSSAKKKKKSEMIAFEDSESEEEEEVEVKKERPKSSGHFACQQCDKSTRQDVLLLCDMCDEGWHTHCLTPMLWYVPDGDWFCPRCQHAMLIAHLSRISEEIKEKLKNKKIEDQKKKAAAERLKREMEFIGISLNNVIPSKTDKSNQKQKIDSESEESDVSSDEDGNGMRKSKKRALKKVMKNRRKVEYYGPVVTIAEGRSRRALNKVDYNFSNYNEQIKEAIESGEELDPHDTRPQGGLGRGKDMANIIEADRQHRGSDDVNSENNIPEKRSTTTRKPALLRKKKPKLTDLNIDDATESESDEYKATSGDEEEEPEPSEDEYLPSDLERRRRGSNRRRSDEKFIDDGSESDYNPRGTRRRKGKQTARRQPQRKGRGKRKRYGYDSSETEDDLSDFSAQSSEDDRKKQKIVKKRKIESEEEESDKDYTASGRPLRRASKKAIEKFHEEEDDDEEEKEDENEKNKRPIGALSRINKKKDDEEEFKPGEEEDEEEEENEEEEEPKSDVEDEEDEEEENENDDSERNIDAKQKPTKADLLKNPVRRNVIGMPPTRRPSGAGVARISSSSEEEADDKIKNKEKDQESEGELPSMVYKNRTSKDIPEEPPTNEKDKNTRSESPKLEDFIQKPIAPAKPTVENAEKDKNLEKTDTPVTTTAPSLAEMTPVPITTTPSSFKKTVIAPPESSALPSWDSLATNSPINELKKLADPNQETTFVPRTQQQLPTTFSAPTYATLNAVPPSYPPFPPHVRPMPGGPMPGYVMPPHPPPGYFPPNYYPPNAPWPPQQPNFLPQVSMPGAPSVPHPGLPGAPNPDAPPPTESESLGHLLAGAMNTEY